MSFEIFLAVVGVLAIAISLFIWMGKSNHGVKHEVDINRQQMKSFEQLAVSQQESDRHMAIVKADSLLNEILKQHGLNGNTMGERMKNAQFSNADSVWSAHKLRNRIAHESDVKLSADGARRALSGFKQAMKDMGAV